MITDLGLRPYAEVWELQKKLQRELIAGGPEHLLVCEHSPVITLGTSSSRSNILVDEAALRTRGIELFEVERGGDVTYHGPGQLVLYPILDLRKRKTDIGWYMRTLEEIVIRTLKSFAIESIRIPGRAGVWIDAHTKIASVGVRLSRWCSMHGLALNLKDCSEGFKLLNPCGFSGIKVTSMEELLGRGVEKAPVQDELLRHFDELLEWATLRGSVLLCRKHPSRCKKGAKL